MECVDTGCPHGEIGPTPDSPDLSFPFGPQPTEILGRLARVRRLALGLAPEDVAERCGLEWTYVLELERGVADPELDIFLLWARGLDLDPVELMRQANAILLEENAWYAEAVRRGDMSWSEGEAPGDGPASR
jgi:transcriptional regulator with XRE-family HTH domain